MMNRRICCSLLVTVVTLFYPAAGWSEGEQQNEQQLIEVLESSTSLQQKNDACSKLKRLASAASVPALAALLPDKDLSHSARYVLESMQAPEAGKALQDALDKSEGLVKAGIIHSLGERGETAAATRLAPLLTYHDANVAAAAATVFARVGGERAADELFAALARAGNADVRAAIADALVTTADRLLAAKKRKEALAIFEKLGATSMPDRLRKAAFVGMMSAADEGRALEMVAAALEGSDAPARQAALEFAREMNTPRVAATLSEILSRSRDASLQVAIIEAMRQRGDKTAAKVLIGMTENSDALVRSAAVTALGELGDSSCVPALVRASASNDESERRAAQQALVNLRNGDVTAALVQQLAASQGEARRAVVRALSVRGDRSATGKLLDLARSGDASARTAALQALVRVARNEDLAAIARLLDSGDSALRVDVAGALVKTCARLQGEGGKVNAEPIVHALQSANADVLMALLPAAGMLGEPRLHHELRGALKSSQPRVRASAVKALCVARDAVLFPDLLNLTKEAEDPNVRVQAMRQCLRLANATTSDSAPEQRVSLLEQILAVAPRPEEKRAVLS
ncbi:MAG: HEAT repeat domain-containing protein, partial [Candidatus Sumerlaeaceae bacterium]